MVLGLEHRCGCGSIPIPNKPQREEGLEVKSGNLRLQQKHHYKVQHVPVFARVYQNSFEHYMVIFRDQKYTNNAVFVNLKHCIVNKSDKKDSEFVIIPDSVDGTIFTFETKSEEDVESWLSVLQSHTQGLGMSPTLSPVIPRTPIMPPLTEAEEEDDWPMSSIDTTFWC